MFEGWTYLDTDIFGFHVVTHDFFMAHVSLIKNLMTVYYIWYLAIWRFPNLGGTTPRIIHVWMDFTINHPFWGHIHLWKPPYVIFVFIGLVHCHWNGTVRIWLVKSECITPRFQGHMKHSHKPWFSMGFTHLWSILWHDFEDVDTSNGIIGHIH